jgi:hypothetical protein
MFNKFYASIAAHKAETVAQKLVDGLLKSYERLLNMAPPLVGEITKVLINNRDDINHAIATGKRVHDELMEIFIKTAEDMKCADDEINKIWETIADEIREFNK